MRVYHIMVDGAPGSLTVDDTLHTLMLKQPYEKFLEFKDTQLNVKDLLCTHLGDTHVITWTGEDNGIGAAMDILPLLGKDWECSCYNVWDDQETVGYFGDIAWPSGPHRDSFRTPTIARELLSWRIENGVPVPETGKELSRPNGLWFARIVIPPMPESTLYIFGLPNFTGCFVDDNVHSCLCTRGSGSSPPIFQTIDGNNIDVDIQYWRLAF